MEEKIVVIGEQELITMMLIGEEGSRPAVGADPESQLCRAVGVYYGWVCAAGPLLENEHVHLNSISGCTAVNQQVSPFHAFPSQWTMRSGIIGPGNRQLKWLALLATVIWNMSPSNYLSFKYKVMQISTSLKYLQRVYFTGLWANAFRFNFSAHFYPKRSSFP